MEQELGLPHLTVLTAGHAACGSCISLWLQEMDCKNYSSQLAGDRCLFLKGPRAKQRHERGVVPGTGDKLLIPSSTLCPRFSRDLAVP